MGTTWGSRMRRRTCSASIMSIPDELMPKYFRLCTAVPVDEVEAIETGLADGNDAPERGQASAGA